MKQADPVDDPQHYGGRDHAYEAIKVMLAWFGPEATAWFCRLNAVKYLARAGKKSDADDNRTVVLVEDLRKASWYSETAANLLEHGRIRVAKAGAGDG